MELRLLSSKTASMSTGRWGRVAYLGFQTVGPAIPVWEGLGPWHHHPAQFSCHVASSDGGLEHVEWLAGGPGDCRAAMADVLVGILEGADAVVAYDAPSPIHRIQAP